MQTRKQQWRKTKSSKLLSQRDKTPSIVLQNGDSLLSMSLAGALFPSISDICPKKLRSAVSLITFLSYSDKLERPKDTRSMRFSSTVHICLIPSRNELMPQLVELFWTSDDYVKFKNDAVSELRTYLTSNGTTAKEAIFKLYQPPDEERRAWMREYEGCRTKEGACEVSETKEDDLFLQASGDILPPDKEETPPYNSREDDDPIYGDDVEGLKKFSNSGKTDIELNAEGNAESNGGRQRAGSLTKMPTKTPAGSSGDNQLMWAVTWKPQ